MRYLFMGDLHSNIEAAETVIDAAGKLGFDQVLVLGDLVGYGANPGEIVDLVQGLKPKAIIRGNHDKVVSGVENGDDFNPIALEAALLNREMLGVEQRRYLAELPAGPVLARQGIMIAHGTPQDEDEYLLDEEDAGLAFTQTDFPICFFGHTHIAGVFILEEGRVWVSGMGEAGLTLPLRKQARYLVNPGSVGQPRDEDPRAGFGILDTQRNEILLRRVEYDIEAAQSAIHSAGLPPILAERLARGL